MFQEAPKPTSNKIELSIVEYSFFAVIMLGGAVIIGGLIKLAFKQLTDSNTELKKAIEKLATVASSIHDDLSDFKTEVADKYATKIDLSTLKSDIQSVCKLRHNRRIDDDKENQ
jgi:hypothetical protein